MDDGAPLVVSMTSCTVFYNTLMSEADWLTIKYGTNVVLAQQIWDGYARWLEEHITGTYNQHTDGVWFLDEADAVMFKLAWSGQKI